MSRCGERVTRDAAHYHTVFNDNIYKQGWGDVKSTTLTFQEKCDEMVGDGKRQQQLEKMA